MLRNSTSVQHVIPTYQRNYTWKANIEVKKLLDDLDFVLEGNQTKHFLGIMIYLQQSSGMFRIECSVIDGQQRLTTIFLLLYALKDIAHRTEQLIAEIARLYPYHAVKDEAMERIPIFLSKQDRTLARAYFFPDNGSVKVLEGSSIEKNESMDSKYTEVAKQRSELLDDGVIEETNDGFDFVHNHLFTSNRGTALSGTASLILHGSRNGKEYWVTEDGNPIYMLINKE